MATAAIPWNLFPTWYRRLSRGKPSSSSARAFAVRVSAAATPQQVIAAHVGRLLLRVVYGARFGDLSPFRAIRRDVLDRLGMSDMTYGWNLEMLMRVAAADLPALRDRCRPTSPGWRRLESFRQFIAGINAAYSMAATFVRPRFGYGARHTFKLTHLARR
jgi:hypothetical protein